MRLDSRTPWKRTTFCERCGRNVAAVSRDEAAEVVELLDLDLEAMIQYGLVHLVDGDRICKASLFSRHHDSH